MMYFYDTQSIVLPRSQTGEVDSGSDNNDNDYYYYDIKLDSCNSFQGPAQGNCAMTSRCWLVPPAATNIMGHCIQLAPLSIKYLFNYSYSCDAFNVNGRVKLEKFQQFHNRRRTQPSLHFAHCQNVPGLLTIVGRAT